METQEQSTESEFVKAGRIQAAEAEANGCRYFEEFILNEPGVYPKCFGVRIVEHNPEHRPFGFYGRRELVLTENVTLKKGHREYVLKASQKKPIHVVTMLQMLEGRK